MGRDELLSLVRREARPLQGLVDVQAVLQQVSQANTVLLGEASHGTHEFYALRAEITKRLITDHGFDAVAVESDWPDALRVSRYVQGSAELVDADDALGAYLRFPRWMWRNTDVRDFVAWLRTHNDGVEPKRRTGSSA
jgi:erythromycin esterase-like protein